MNLYEWINLNHIVGFLLLVFRMSGLFIVSPLFSNRAVSARIKLALIVMFSAALLPMVSHDLRPSSTIELIVWSIREVTIGVVIGFVAAIFFAGIQAAGDIIGTQVGYAMATIFDPSNETDSGVITSFYVILGALIFLYLDGHHLILSALTRSFDILPIASPISLGFGIPLSKLCGNILIAAIQFSSPVLVVVLILNFMFGMITKLSPQMNIYFNAGFIIGPMVGLIVLMITLPLFRVLMGQMTEHLGPDMLKIVHELKGV